MTQIPYMLSISARHWLGYVVGLEHESLGDRVVGEDFFTNRITLFFSYALRRL